MDSKSLYQQLLDYEPLGFIDPFNDLGTYDALQKALKSLSQTCLILILGILTVKLGRRRLRQCVSSISPTR